MLATPASSTSLSRGGETASFVRLTDDGRMVVRCRDEEILVEKAHRLTGMELKKGDEVLWDRNAWMAMEKIPRAPDSSYFLEKTPSETFSQVGGLDRQIRSVTSSIRLHFKEQDRVRKYQLRPRGSVLLVGPPGNGKTLVAKALANWLRELSPCDKVRFIHIPPAGLHTSWYGETERNYRHVFSTGREFANREPDVPVVLFFDEIDAVGVSRGSSYHHIDDRVQTAFMSELDGLEARGNILVLAATNRRDALDPALLRPGRLSDLVVEIPRPNREAAREILSKHLPEAIPYATNGSGTETGGFRADLIDSIVSRLYVPNGEGNLAPFLRERQMHWDELDKFFALREEMFELDTRFTQIGSEGIFSMLDRAGELDHSLPALLPVQEAVTQPPSSGRARLRGQLVRRLAGETSHFRCDWNRVWDMKENRIAELKDPFGEEEKWQEGTIEKRRSVFRRLFESQALDL